MPRKFVVGVFLLVEGIKDRTRMFSIGIGRKEFEISRCSKVIFHDVFDRGLSC